MPRLLDHLGLKRDPEPIAKTLYEPSQPTFHRGKTAAFRDVYTDERLSLFEARYGHLLDMYGYARATGQTPGAPRRCDAVSENRVRSVGLALGAPT